MKKIMLLTILGASLLSFNTTIQASDQLAVSMCDYVAANDKNRLRKVLSDNRLRLRNIYDGVVCDGENLVRFAAKKESDDVGEFIVKQLPGSHFSDGSDLAWIESQGIQTNISSFIKERVSSE